MLVEDQDEIASINRKPDAILRASEQVVFVIAIETHCKFGQKSLGVGFRTR
jgi:hypothetical protein